MNDLLRMSFTNMNSINADIIAIDQDNGNIIFTSCIGYNALIKQYAKAFNFANTAYITGRGSFRTIPFGYTTERKSADSDFTHLVVSSKDKEFKDSDGRDRLTAYFFCRNEEEKLEMLYDKLYSHLSVPLLPEWMNELFNSLEHFGYIKKMRVYHSYDTPVLSAYRLNITQNVIVDIVSNKIKDGIFTIGDTNEVSDTMNEITGLDSYLNTFGETLAEKIQESFVPKFDPNKDKYTEGVNDFDDACYSVGINIFAGQKAVIQAAVNNLKKSNITFVIAEQGSGKTLMGSGITYAHKKRIGNTSIVMCPSHLVKKWKREVERLVPNGKGYIIRDLAELKAIEQHVLDKNKKENSYIIFSKESAKFSYEMCPSAVWSKSKKAFVCPECGQVLKKKVNVGTGRHKTTILMNFEKNDMSKEYAFNKVCTNKVKVWSEEDHMYKEKECHAKLWKPLNKEDINSSEWVKLGKEGWLLKDHVVELYDELSEKNNLTKKETQLLVRLEEKVDELDLKGDIQSFNRAPRKYSLAKYIKRYWKGKIDYFVADECQDFLNESEQGFAFFDFVKASKKTICLTGTLLNGYADGLFYILYRTMPRSMIKDGFDYNGSNEFLRTYGVIKKNNRFEINSNGTTGQRIGLGSEKKLPGVSPLVFTKFLLDNAVFLSLSDLSEGLPEYTEIPVGVDMDAQLRASYDALENTLRNNMGGFNGQGMKLMGQLVQTLSAYPDQPYDQPPILHPDTGDVIIDPIDLGEELRSKELVTLDLIEEKVAAGEKVLLFYQWTTKTDVAKKLSNALQDRGISTAILEAKVKPELREEWIAKQSESGVQVVLCNPTLVETGLDLMEFTTIIFYQLGYNVFTMRQASRRSWRLGQEHPIEVYFIYYRDTVQEQTLSLMATKLQASMAIEGKFSEECLRAMSNNEDVLTQIANSVVNGIKNTVDVDMFSKSAINSSIIKEQIQDRVRKTREELEFRRKMLSKIKSHNPRLDLQTTLQDGLLKSMLNNTMSIWDIYA